MLIRPDGPYWPSEAEVDRALGEACRRCGATPRDAEPPCRCPPCPRCGARHGTRHELLYPGDPARVARRSSRPGDLLTALAVLEALVGREHMRALGDLAERDWPDPGPRDLWGRARRDGAAPPPRHEVAALWARCRPVTEEAVTADLLAAVGILALQVAAADLGRALPPRGGRAPGGILPDWASGPDRRRSWRRSGHWIVLPLHDDGGAVASVLGWRPGRRPRRPAATLHGVRPGELRVRVPVRYATDGLVLADPAGVGLLAGEAGLAQAAGVTVVQGVERYLQWSTAPGPRPPVLGVLEPASWSPAIAARVPSGTRVVVDGGERVAQAVARSLAGRCDVEQVRS